MAPKIVQLEEIDENTYIKHQRIDARGFGYTRAEARRDALGKVSAATSRYEDSDLVVQHAPRSRYNLLHLFNQRPRWSTCTKAHVYKPK